MSNPDISRIYPGWVVKKVIGHGSFGSVYEIERDVFGSIEKAALKLVSIPQGINDIEDLRNDGYDDETITTRFEGYLHDIVKEYSLMASMKGHPNAVYCDDVKYIQHDDGIGWDIYIKMELLTPLNKAISPKTLIIPEEQVIKIGEDMCNILGYCESKKIIHRDIKPQNIFVSEDGTYKLGDFGIAKTAERTTSGTKTGTYKYMAPEVYNNKPYGSKADIYSLGLTLYWLLNEKRSPFLPLPPAQPTSSDEDEARRRRFEGEPIKPPAHGSEELKRIVLKACAYDPDERYQSAKDMLADLRKLSGGAIPGVIPVIPADGGKQTASEDISRSDEGGTVGGAHVAMERNEGGTVGGAHVAIEHDEGGTVGGAHVAIGYDEGGTVGGAHIDKFHDEEGTMGGIHADTRKNEEEESAKAAAAAAALAAEEKRRQEEERLRQAEEEKRRQEEAAAAAAAAAAGKKKNKDKKPKEEKEKKKILPFILIGLIVIGALLFLLLRPKTVKMPYLVNMPRTQAEQTLRQAELTNYVIKEQQSDTVPAGNVISTTPQANRDVKKSDKIYVYVSAGPGKVALEDLKGKTLEEAKGILENAGFKVAVEEANDDAVPTGSVISQSPAAGTELEKGSEVKLVVSKGPGSIKISDVAGKSLAEAKQALENQGLVVESSEQYSDTVASGKVISQEPAAGTEAAKGDTVTLTVSKGKAPVNSYTVTLDANGGNVSPKSISVTAGGKYGSLPTPTRTGYKFNGWFTAKTGGKQVTASSALASNSNHTLYAQWYTLTFNPNGGSVSETSRKVKEGSTYGTLPTPTRSGYAFNGWYTAASGGTKIGSSTKMGKANVTVYAQWVANAYTLSFNANGGSCSETSRAVSSGSTYGTLPTPTRSGYTFKGWYTAASGGSQVSSSTKMGTSNTTIYAQWTVITHTLTFNANGGSVSETSRTVNEYAAYGTLPTPTRTGYTFNGWYTAASGGTKVSNTTTMGTANVTLYAHWTGVSVTYTIKYVSSNGADLGSTSATHSYGSGSYTISAPAKTGYSTPASQSVTWDSTSAKTITFTYTPTSVGSTVVKGNLWMKSSSVGLHYEMTISFRNRTANSIEYMATCKMTKDKGCYYGYTQKFDLACGSVTTGGITICDASKMGSSTSNSVVTASKSSGWVKITGLSATTTSVSMKGEVWSASDSTNFTKTVTIPTY